MTYLHEYRLIHGGTERRGTPMKLEQWRLVADQYAAEIERLRGKEREAFAAGFEAAQRLGVVSDEADQEREWQQYRCRDDSDWRAR